ncbi:hypothetical protein GCM10007923_46630 [Shinella yambaruensis]|uniref:Uncharacterized protein n=1 Tax=Shinella yambaruensis TaxID=415996 RepID=A0ABQ5ZRG4_9HYPH|nr:hypothetical protein GCM10007923_46630 [Shinella yambaruensis]
MQRQIDGRKAVAGAAIIAEPLKKLGMGLQHAGKQGARHPLHQPEGREIDRFCKERGKHAAGLRQKRIPDPREPCTAGICARSKTTTFFPCKGAA